MATKLSPRQPSSKGRGVLHSYSCGPLVPHGKWRYTLKGSLHRRGQRVHQRARAPRVHGEPAPAPASPRPSLPRSPNLRRHRLIYTEEVESNETCTCGGEPKRNEPNAEGSEGVCHWKGAHAARRPGRSRMVLLPQRAATTYTAPRLARRRVQQQRCAGEEAAECKARSTTCPRRCRGGPWRRRRSCRRNLSER